MTYQATDIPAGDQTVSQPRSQVTPGYGETLEDVAFLSGAALARLDLLLTRPDVPLSLLRERLALTAAEACVTHQGRPERVAELRDALAFLQPGDSPGPAGEVYRAWHLAIGRRGPMGSLERALPGYDPQEVRAWAGETEGGPVRRAASVLQRVVERQPRDPVAALLCAEAALSAALGWSRTLPVLTLGLRRADLRRTADDLRLVCHRAIASAEAVVTREASDLTRRAARLTAVAPKLRAKGAGEAVALFLTSDAVAPAALTALRSPRAARRFCDRLVELGAVRELTGRDSFRLYGV
ncbi:DUF1403 family protein [Alphaproteobacteria bacterium GH1-50]|uniref:DUF1403 family protein n=1 Tax=Kangsaoukella pontilimi TaxID=2691042 RepID=A0A7C9MSY3_9RHOB|nr:DUF1403 family protein [Kangsaoukella pontilimi]MXQ09717.1 DUF1403 family protein [Kangsaoukella pontilimi]